MTMKIKKLYLGDSVFMCWDGGVLILTTENGLPTDPSNTIFLEPEVLNTLIIAIEAKRKVT